MLKSVLMTFFEFGRSEHIGTGVSGTVGRFFSITTAIHAGAREILIIHVDLN